MYNSEKISGSTSSFSMRKIFFPVSARNWTVMERVQLNYDGQTANFNGSRGIYSPAEYSFHCQIVSNAQGALLVPQTVTDSATHWTILFTDFQVPSHSVSALSQLCVLHDPQMFPTSSLPSYYIHIFKPLVLKLWLRNGSVFISFLFFVLNSVEIKVHCHLLLYLLVL